MRDAGETSELLLQPVDARGRDDAEGLERDDLATGAINDLVDHTHTARAKSSEHGECSVPGEVVGIARRQRQLTGRSRNELHSGGLRAVARAPDTSPDHPRTPDRKPSRSVGGLSKRFVEQRSQPPVPVGSPRCGRHSWTADERVNVGSSSVNWWCVSVLPVRRLGWSRPCRAAVWLRPTHPRLNRLF